jgi:3-deoxy-D-manno-octulosonic-acid transferase
LPFILIRLLWRSRKSPAYRKRWAERFGFFKFKPTGKTIWIHAVSFGEAKIASTLIQKLKLLYPQLQFVVTTMTITGSEHIRKTLGKQVFHVYVPYDLPDVVQRFLRKINPTLVILVETELWPNLLYHCKQKKIPVLIVNARLSEASAKGYGLIGLLTRQMLKSITYALTQTKTDAERFIKLGLNSECAKAVGNIKFDITPPETLQIQANQLRENLGTNRPVLIAASTHHGEEQIILKAFSAIKKSVPECLLILVPRHPERFDAVADLCKKSDYQLSRRSENKIHNTIDIYLGDTMGELWLFYATSDVAFVGGSLVPIGGHNLLEPAALALPIVTGSHLFHFEQISQLLQQQNALTIINDELQFTDTILQLLQNQELRQQKGMRAQQVVTQNRGALEKHLEVIGKFCSIA